MTVSAAHRDVVSFRSSALGRMWTFSVLLPPAYHEDASVSFPVVFLLHGYGGSEALQDMSAERMTTWMDEGLIESAILIGPNGYDSWFLNFHERMSDAFLGELLPEVRKRYRVQQGPSSTSLCGFSMGGYAALRFLLLQPAVFGAAALISPAVYDPLPPPSSSARVSHVFGQPFSENVWSAYNYTALLPGYIESAPACPIWIAAGVQDIHVQRAARRLFRRLVQGGKPASYLAYPDGHVAPSWVFLAALHFLLSYAKAHTCPGSDTCETARALA